MLNLRDLLLSVYPENESLVSDVRALIDRFPAPDSTPRPLADSLLICYGDQVSEPGVPPLQTLGKLMNGTLKNVVGGVHILPFYPSSSDDGFSVCDYEKVDPALGDWDDIVAIGREHDVMFDAVFNHASAQGVWFAKFLAQEPGWQNAFVTESASTDLSAVVRPRALPLLTEFETAAGPRHVWTTFSADQVDLNFRDPAIFLRVAEVLLFYIRMGARWIRLDAIAFLWKVPGTTCVHLPETHRIIQCWRAILDEVAPHVRIVTETNVPHVDNISYFGDGTNEAHLVYNFALPPLVFHTIRSGDATKLRQWAATLALPSADTSWFNFLASHDGIGLNPARGILEPSEIAALVESAQNHGGFVSYKTNPDQSKSPYELNISYFDALSDPASDEPESVQVARFLAAHAILIALQGVPAIYFHSLFGSRGDRAAAVHSGIPRRINRAKTALDQIEAALADPTSRRALVFRGISELLAARRAHDAFSAGSPQSFPDSAPGLVVIERGHGRALCVVNVTAETVPFAPPGPEWKCIHGSPGPLAPYASGWFVKA